jgi:N-acetylmuramoyl-L-alanine amidase
VTRPFLGAHAGGFNTNTTGVAMLGTFTTSRPPAAMLAAMQRLLAWKLDLTHVDPAGGTILESAGGANVRYPAGRKVFASTIIGHRSTSFTTCPGSPTLALLRSIRANVARIGRPKIYRGTGSTGRVQPERGVATGVYAHFSSNARWRVTITGSQGGTVRSFSGVGASARVGWSGRTASGALAPPGWATVTVTASAVGRSARPAVSRVFVDRTAPPAGTSSGGFSAGAWAVNNVNVEQLSRSSRVLGSFTFGRAGDLPIFGDWDGDGPWTPAAIRGGVWTLRATNDGTSATSTVSFGQAGDRYLAGDWDGDGTWTPGVLRAGVKWYLKNSFGGGAAAVGLASQTRGTPVVGDWDNRP